MNFYLHFLLLCFIGSGSAVAQSKLPACPFFGEKHNCFGSYTFPSGSKYVGEFKANKLEGQGTYSFANGDKYVGEFKVSMRNGKGTMTFANGNKFIGEYKNGKRSGNGTLFAAAGQIISEGVWDDDKFVKQQTLSTPEQSRKPPVNIQQPEQTNAPTANTNVVDQPKVAMSGVNQIQEGFEYSYFPDGSCDEKDLTKCLSVEQYESICKLTKGVTKKLVGAGSFLLPNEDRTLLEGGSISDVSVSWGKSRDGKERCFYAFTSSGIYQGNSARKNFGGVVTVFIKSKGEVLAHYKLF